MERLKPRRAVPPPQPRLDVELVFVCTVPIAALGARAGDELVVRLHHPDFPVVLRRTFQEAAAAQIPPDSVRLLYAEPFVDESVARGLLRQCGAPPPGSLRLEP